MADPTMLSLFENENGMIDDLGAITDNGFPPSQHSIAGHMPTGGSSGSSSSNGSATLHGPVHPHMTSQTDPMLGPMQTQTFSQIAAPPLHHQNASTPQASGSHPPKFHSFDEFDQFPSQKLHYIGDSPQTQEPGIISHFGQPSQHSGRTDGPFPQYPMQGNPGMQQEQQQSVEMTQPSMWPAQQSTVPHGTTAYIPEQHMPSYLTHHDYAMSSSQSRLSHFNDQSNPANQGTTYIPNMSSSPPTQRLSHIPLASPNHMSGMSRPRTVASNTPSPLATSPPFPSSQPMNNQDSLSNFPHASNQHQTAVRHYGFPDEIPRPQININSGQNLSSPQMQHFSFNQHQTLHPQSNSQTMHPPRNLNENSQLSHFSNQMSNSNPQYRPPFPHMSPTRHTPPPPSRTPECHPHPPTSTQGNFAQSSLQQLEQMVAPHGNTKTAPPTSNPFHPIMQPNSGSNSNNCIPINQHNITVSVSHPQIFNTQPEFSTLHVSQANIGNVSANINAPSPSSLAQQTNNINFEVQQIQQHLQQLYKMPQSPRTQQKIMELQERLRILQQQNHQHQQMQQQQQVQLVNQLIQKTQQSHQQQSQPIQQTRILQVTQTNQSSVPKQNQELVGQSQVAVSTQQLTIVQQPSLQRTPTITCLQKLSMPSLHPQSQLSQQQSHPLQLQQQQQISTAQKLPQQQQQLSPLLLPQSSHQNQLQQSNSDHTAIIDDKERARLFKQQQQQEKANRIVMEAIAKAQAAGNTQLPKVLTPPPISVTLPATETSEETKIPKDKKVKISSKGSISRSSSKKTKLTTVTFGKKKKRKKGGSDISDMDATPPPSPHLDENAIQQRRSARNTKRKKYTDDFDINISDDDNLDIIVDVLSTPSDFQAYRNRQFFVENPNEEDAMIVEKILAFRIFVKQSDDGSEPVEVEEYFVKYKNFSYLHCEWKTIDDLGKDKRIHMKIKRFKQKKALTNYFFELNDEPFNPDFVEVDRVLEVSTTIDPVTGDRITHYLVKWRSLPYEDSTWELAEDVDYSKIDQFNRIKIPPPKEEWEKKERPKPSDWYKREESRVYKGGNTLRYYQLEGVNWLLFSWYNRQNCILADEMGLGKTIQSITFLEEVSDYNIKGPHLVIAPLSTITNWQREFETWSNMNAIVYHGSSPSRNMIQEYEMYYKNEKGFRIPHIYKFNALITTYEIIIADCLELKEIPWRCVIIDEAHRLKNKNCKLLEGLKLLDMEHRVLLTGTPLQNNVEELFSLLNFLEPARFPNSESFMQEFGELMTEAQVEKLQQLLKPMMLRRLKEDVEKNIAPKEETIVEVELTNIQKKYYRAILERNFSFLAKGSSNVPNLVNTMMELRKCCNHPYLIAGAEEKIVDEYRSQCGEICGYFLQAMIRSSGKLVLIDKLLPKLKAGGHKLLIFSQMVRCLDILEDYMLQKGYLYERLDGKVRGDARQASIDRFSKPDSDKFAFLLCTRAGGLGINLTAADTVIIFDSDWNPQNDLQAQARCHRIGQEKPVKVYRLITRNSYEREMFDRASKKLGLDKAVLQSMSGNKEALNTQLSKKDIEDLLRRGAYGAIMDDDNEGDQFCEEDIDLILKRRTQIIQIESGTKGSTFAKASFVAEGNRTDIDINDPNFWQKWAKKADIQLDDAKNELIVTEPRRRQQTRRFGGDDSVLEMSDLESSSEDDENKKNSCRKSGRRKKLKDDDYEEDIPTGSWTRSECFKVEKNLLTYGWGRWSDILAHGRFKRKLIDDDVETISRTMLRYCLKYYKGDEKIKGFIWDLITPAADGEVKSYKNHSGLSAPVPRGRKGKKSKKEAKHHFSPDTDWDNDKEDPERLLRDDGYKKHLQRHSNKVLLRVRLLYYLKQEVIGDFSERIAQGIYASDLGIIRTTAEGEPPSYWWDQECDWSLLIGVYKHGYEKYNLMRRDPSLCFLARCGPPDGLAVLAEENDEENYGEDDRDPFFKPDKGDRDDIEDYDCLSPGSPIKEVPSITPFQPAEMGEFGKLPFPSPSDLNTRLRRIITGFQRNHKKQALKMAQKAKKLEKKERFEAAIRERENKKKEMQQRRWSRREDADFYRTVSTYGIDYNIKTDKYNWATFRAIARLEKKYNETLTEHFRAFYAMCKKVCNRKITEEEERMPLLVEPITEERASRCLQRIELLNKIRQEILHHPQLDERLKLCQPSMELPDWWVCGKHDKDLLRGAAKHGLSRTDYHILHDPELSFKEVLQSLPQSGPNSFAQPSSINNNTQSSIETQNGVIEEDDIKEVIDKDAEIKNNNSLILWDKSVIKETEVNEINKNFSSSLQVKESVSNGTVQHKIETCQDKIKPEDDDEDYYDDIVELKFKPKESEDKPLVNGPQSQEDTNLSYLNDDTASHHSFGLDIDGNEPTVAQLLAQSMHNPVRWPKDKILQIRLEHICHCVENNEWPVTRRFIHEPMFPSSVTNTPPPTTPDHTPKRETSTPMSEYGVLDGSDHISGDRLKVTLQRKRKRRKKVEIEAERVAKLQALLSHSITALSNTEDSQAEDSTPPPPAHQNGSPRISLALHPSLTNNSSTFTGPNGFINGAINDIALDLQVKKKHKHRLEDDYDERRHRRKEKYRDKEEGKLRRRRKKHNHNSSTKMWTPTNLDPEARVPVMNIDDGTTLSGDEAPMHKDLAQWLSDHPNYIVIRPDLDDKYEEQDLHELVDKRRKRKPRVDPNKLNFDNLTGDENVSVINRHTGKKITGRKAPPLKYLGDWLQKNPAFDVDPKWALLVKEKGNLPEQLKPRILTLSDRKKKFNSGVLSSSLLTSGDIASFSTMTGLGNLPGLSGANLLANFSGVKLPLDQGKNSATAMYLPFGGLTNIGLGNPMFNLSNFGFAGLSVSSTGITNSIVDTKLKDSDSSDSKSASSGSTSIATTTTSTNATNVTATSIPFIFPATSLLYNPLFAQNYGNFSLPANMPTSFATLAQGGLVNGLRNRNGNSIAQSSDDDSVKSLADDDDDDKNDDDDDDDMVDTENDSKLEKNYPHEILNKNLDISPKKEVSCNILEDKSLNKLLNEAKSEISGDSSELPLSSKAVVINILPDS